tara:strand:+ start:309 stop:491 length:183 start_codon:yes stop_codon:yes gene_type:complete
MSSGLHNSSTVFNFMSEHHFWLSESQFIRLEPLLPNKPRGFPRIDDRRVISGIIHLIRGD